MLKLRSYARINKNSCLGDPRSLKEPCPARTRAEKIIKKINRLKNRNTSGEGNILGQKLGKLASVRLLKRTIFKC